MFDAIEEKAGASRSALAKAGLLDAWQEKRQAFMKKLGQAAFGAVVMDYDGTVYGGGQLHGAVLDKDMAALLANMLRHGLAIGFASGRGLSLRDALRETFAPSLWPAIHVAYQDGGETGRLDDDSLPTPYDPSLEFPDLAKARRELETIYSMWPAAPDLRPENSLLGLRSDPQNVDHVFKTACEVALPLGLKLFKSGKMVDILPRHVSKAVLVKELGSAGIAVMAIGDAGQWPGNDCELLATSFGLSVGSVSAEPDSCWRVTEKSGIEACREILASLKRMGEGPLHRLELN